MNRANSDKTELIRVLEGLEIVAPYPAAFLSRSSSLVVSDIHLGIESALAAKGIYIPDSMFRRTIDSILIPIRETRARVLYVLGDLIHSHRKPGEPEWWAVRKFAEEVRAAGAEPVLVRGNHDLRIATMLRSLQIRYHQRFVRVDDFILTHGHRKVRLDSQRGRTKAIIMGHEHPAVSIRDEFGGHSERFKAFLLIKNDPRGAKRGRPALFVLPSVNPVSIGIDLTSRGASDDFLSPYLRGIPSRDIQPFVLEVGELLLPFPSLSFLGS